MVLHLTLSERTYRLVLLSLLLCLLFPRRIALERIVARTRRISFRRRESRTRLIVGGRRESISRSGPLLLVRVVLCRLRASRVLLRSVLRRVHLRPFSVRILGVLHGVRSQLFHLCLLLYLVGITLFTRKAVMSLRDRRRKRILIDLRARRYMNYMRIWCGIIRLYLRRAGSSTFHHHRLCLLLRSGRSLLRIDLRRT